MTTFTSTFTLTRDDVDIKVEVTASIQPAEYDVGIMGDYWEELIATVSEGPDEGTELNLTEREEDYLGEKLMAEWHESRRWGPD